MSTTTTLRAAGRAPAPPAASAPPAPGRPESRRPVTQSFYLAVEFTTPNGNGPVPIQRGADGLPVGALEVGAGPSALVLQDGGGPALRSAAERLPQWLLEPLRDRQGQPRLLLVSSPGSAPRLNREVAPRVVALKEGDQVRLRDGLALHVCLRRRAPIGPAAQLGVVDKVCPVCLGKLEADDLAYACDCGSVFHCNEPGRERLECARTLGRCLGCEQELVLKESFTPLAHLES
jgi:hypothetical protein